MTNTKICTRCKKEKPSEEFSSRQAMCKQCRREKYSGHKYNRPIYTEQEQEEYAAAHPDKTCRKCKVEKPLQEFAKDKNTRDGRYSVCAECKAKYNQHHWKIKTKATKKTPATKICSRCGVEKSSKEFSPDRRTNDGLYSSCKECSNKHKTHYSHEYQTAYRKKHPLKKCPRCGEKKPYEEFYKNNSSDNRTGYSSLCIPCRKAYVMDEWRPNGGREYSAVAAQIRRSRKANTVVSLTREDWLSILEAYDYTCLCCGSTDKKLTMDHVIPVSLGGETTKSNIQPLCGSCNSAKHTSIVDYRPDKGALWT